MLSSCNPTVGPLRSGLAAGVRQALGEPKAQRPGLDQLLVAARNGPARGNRRHIGEASARLRGQIREEEDGPVPDGGRAGAILQGPAGVEEAAAVAVLDEICPREATGSGGAIESGIVLGCMLMKAFTVG